MAGKKPALLIKVTIRGNMRRKEMKIVVINCSPNMDKDNTALIINPFLEGMKEAGAEVTLSYIKKLKIKRCRGCNMCLSKTPGKCFQRDDMKGVLSELSQAEVWVFATPLTSDGIPAPLKKLVGRMLPLTMGGGTKAGKLVLVSSCDNWELGYFDPLVQHMRSIAQTYNKEFAGSLLRPHAGVMGPMLKEGSSLDDIVTAAYEAGQQLVLNGMTQPETLAVVSREILPRESIVTANHRRFWQIFTPA
jgi:multimeric flavodoxin WrbA